MVIVSDAAGINMARKQLKKASLRFEAMNEDQFSRFLESNRITAVPAIFVVDGMGNIYQRLVGQVSWAQLMPHIVQARNITKSLQVAKSGLIEGTLGGSNADQLYLPSTGARVVSRSIPKGAQVTVTIEGVVGIWRGWDHGVDAAYVYDAPSGTYYYPVTTPKPRLGVLTGNGAFDPQPPLYKSDHKYTWQTVGKGEGLWFQFQDEPGAYGDNSGSLKITLTWVESATAPSPTADTGLNLTATHWIANPSPGYSAGPDLTFMEGKAGRVKARFSRWQGIGGGLDGTFKGGHLELTQETTDGNYITILADIGRDGSTMAGTATYWRKSGNLPPKKWREDKHVWKLAK